MDSSNLNDLNETQRYLINQGGIGIALLIVLVLLIGAAIFYWKVLLPAQEKRRKQEAIARRDEIGAVLRGFETSTKNITHELQQLRAEASKQSEQATKQMFGVLDELTDLCNRLEEAHHIMSRDVDGLKGTVNAIDGRLTAIERINGNK